MDLLAQSKVAEAVIDNSPWISVIGSLIGWTFFLIALSMFKSFISNGFSIALSEFLLKAATPEQRERYCRWFGNGDTILEHLKLLDEKLKPGE